MPFVAALNRGLIALALLLVASAPAGAQVQKLLKRCDTGMCAYFRAAIPVPEGWAENKDASEYFGAQMLLPRGVEFDKAPAKIYAAVRFNPKQQPIADFIPDALAQWREAAKDAKITRLSTMSRAGRKPPYERHRFEAPTLDEQGFELQAVTGDTDADGNHFIVTIVLSANSAAALKSAEPAYLSILSRY
jgi:hypothetical protein